VSAKKKSLGKSVAQSKPVTVVFYSHEKDEELFQVDLPDVTVSAFQRAAKNMIGGRGRLLRLAIENQTAQTQSQLPGQQEAESAGNFNVRIECCVTKCRALQKINKKLKPRRDRPIGEIADYVLNSALLHWDKLVPFVCAHEDYAKAEGFFQTGAMQTFNEKTIARNFKVLEAAS
jgi:hypothetical protein